VWHRDQDKNEQGATLVEYAVVAPFLFLLLFGIVEFALLISSFTGVWTSAREGARYATTISDSALTPGTPRYVDCVGIRSSAQGLVVLGEPTLAEITIDYYDQTGVQIADCDDADPTYPTPTASIIPSGSRVEVTITKDYDAIVPLLGRFIDGVTLDSTQSRSIYQGVVGAG
jgi:Flp pilus assembly pilin Flp